MLFQLNLVYQLSKQNCYPNQADHGKQVSLTGRRRNCAKLNLVNHTCAKLNLVYLVLLLYGNYTPCAATLLEWYSHWVIGMILSLGLTNPPYLQVIISLPTKTDSLLPYLLPSNLTPLLLLSLAGWLVIIPTQYFRLKLLPNHTSRWLTHHLSHLTCAKRNLVYQNLVYPYLANTGW